MGINASTIKTVVALIPAVEKVVTFIFDKFQEYQRQKHEREQEHRDFFAKHENNQDIDEVQRELARVQREMNQRLQQQQNEIDDLVNRIRQLSPNRNVTAAHQGLVSYAQTLQYDSSFPIPAFLRKHKEENPDSYYIQIIGIRGCGKSTFVNKILSNMGFPFSAKTGIVETTLEPVFYEITTAVRVKPEGIKNIFLVDMPGIGGLIVNAAGYLKNFGPGHFHLSFLLADSGFNEYENYFFQHLLMNNKQLVFVRTKCDAAITGVQATNDDMSRDNALNTIQEQTTSFVESNTSTYIKLFLTGLPARQFTDWNKITEMITTRLQLHSDHRQQLQTGKPFYRDQFVDSNSLFISFVIIVNTLFVKSL